jgi:hypothetical protein
MQEIRSKVMENFPRTEIGGLSVSRMIIGTNWFLGYSHCTAAKDELIRTQVHTREKIADIIEVFLKAGVDTLMAPMANFPLLSEAISEAQDRTGVEAIIISTPSFTTGPDTPLLGMDMGEVTRVLDKEVELGAHVCMPHTSTTDNLVDRCSRTIRHMDTLCALIHERGMRTGLSTHMPEAIVFSDESGLEVDTYISMYNAMGFLMQLEVDWVGRLIQNAKKPVITIKPMAAGQLRPFQALNFVWNTIRPQDMVTVGTMTPREASECVELSLDILSGKAHENKLQETRSKASVK